MTITSTRDERLHVPPPVGRTDVAGFFAGRPTREGASRWIAALYFVIALATPFLLYAGPEVLSPAVPAIADHAVDGTFAISLHTSRINGRRPRHTSLGTSVAQTSTRSMPPRLAFAT